MIFISSLCKGFGYLKQIILEFLLWIFFYEGLEAEIFMRRIQNPKEAAVKILDQGAQYFLRYDLCKLGFLQALEINLKEVTLVNSS